MSILGVEVGKTCRGFSTFSTTSAVGCPSPNATTVMFQPEGQNIRWRADGVAPTTTVGFLVVAGTTVCFTGDLSKVQFIGVAGGGTLNISTFE